MGKNVAYDRYSGDKNESNDTSLLKIIQTVYATRGSNEITHIHTYIQPKIITPTSGAVKQYLFTGSERSLKLNIDDVTFQ